MHWELHGLKGRVHLVLATAALLPWRAHLLRSTFYGYVQAVRIHASQL
jgi:hypothetical protein